MESLMRAVRDYGEIRYSGSAQNAPESERALERIRLEAKMLILRAKLDKLGTKKKKESAQVNTTEIR